MAVLKKTGAILSIALIAGCAALESRTVEERVASRSEEWLAALMAGQHEKALQFTLPDYRKTTSLTSYASKYDGAVTWKSAKVSRIDCEAVISTQPDSCELGISVEAFIPAARMNSYAAFVTRWVLVDGHWYVAH